MKNEIEVLYSGGIRLALDTELKKMAASLDGKLNGSGVFLLGGGQRDLSFAFKTKARAMMFQKAARVILKNHGVKA